MEQETEKSTELVATSPQEVEARFDWKNASKFVSSKAIPSSIRGDVGSVFAIMQTGREMGIGPMRALRSFIMVDGNLGMKSQFLQSLILEAGHTIAFDEVTETKCVLTGTRKDNGMTYTAKFTIEDAQKAGLIRAGGAWTKYPEDMCFARCISKLARRLFTDIVAGGYVEEEITEMIMEERAVKKPATLAEAAEKAVTGDIAEAEVVPEVDLASDDQVGDLVVMRKENNLTKEQAKDVRDFVEGNGWSFGEIDPNSGRYINHHIPIEAIDQIAKYILSFRKVDEEVENAMDAAMAKDELIEKPAAKLIDQPSNEAGITAQQKAKIFAIIGKLSPKMKKIQEDQQKVMFGEKSRKDFTIGEASRWIEYLELLQTKEKAK